MFSLTSLFFLPCLSKEWILRSPLHIAAYSGDLAHLQQLLETSKTIFPVQLISFHSSIPNTADVDTVEENGRTAIMYSAMADRLECVELLLQKGALITAQDSNGQTALHWAALMASQGSYLH